MFMKYAEMIKKDAAALEKIEETTQIDLMKHMAQVATGAPGKDSGKVRELKRTIARIKMALAAKKDTGDETKETDGGVRPK